jgi:tetratricopeptide (TPR) repeat protein
MPRHKTSVLMLIAAFALIVHMTPALAQDATETPEPPPNCPAFADQSADIRTSYYMGEGIAYVSSSQLSNAEFSFTCVIRVTNPSYVAAYMERASVYAQERDYKRAVDDYSKAVELNPNQLEAYNNRGVIYTVTQEYDKAIADFDHVLQVNADYIPGYNNRAVVYVIQGDFAHAIDLLQQGITRSGIDGALAQYRDPNRPADATPIPFDPLAARSYALLGIIYSAYALNNYQDYIDLYDRAGQFPDQRIQSAAGALQSQFTFDMRLDDGTWMLIATYSPTGSQGG